MSEAAAADVSDAALTSVGGGRRTGADVSAELQQLTGLMVAS